MINDILVLGGIVGVDQRVIAVERGQVRPMLEHGDGRLCVSQHHTADGREKK